MHLRFSPLLSLSNKRPAHTHAPPSPLMYVPGLPTSPVPLFTVYGSMKKNYVSSDSACENSEIILYVLLVLAILPMHGSFT